MDLYIETKDYEFSTDRTYTTYVEIFMANELNCSLEMRTYYLTKKEIKKLIDFLEKNDATGMTYDKFKNMYLLMSTKEKASFKFW